MAIFPLTSAAANYYGTLSLGHLRVPRHKFQHFVLFTVSDDFNGYTGLPLVEYRGRRPFGLLVRTVSRPAYRSEVAVQNAYNRKVTISTQMSFEPIRMSVYDTYDGAFLNFLVDWLRHAIKDQSAPGYLWQERVSHRQVEDSVSTHGRRLPLIPERTHFFDSVTVYELGPYTGNRWVARNARVSSLTVGENDYTDGASPMTLEIELVPEVVQWTHVGSPLNELFASGADPGFDLSGLCDTTSPTRSLRFLENLGDLGVPVPSGARIMGLGEIADVDPRNSGGVGDFGMEIVPSYSRTALAGSDGRTLLFDDNPSAASRFAAFGESRTIVADGDSVEAAADRSIDVILASFGGSAARSTTPVTQVVRSVPAPSGRDIRSIPTEQRIAQSIGRIVDAASRGDPAATIEAINDLGRSISGGGARRGVSDPVGGDIRGAVSRGGTTADGGQTSFPAGFTDVPGRTTAPPPSSRAGGSVSEDLTRAIEAGQRIRAGVDRLSGVLGSLSDRDLSTLTRVVEAGSRVSSDPATRVGARIVSGVLNAALADRRVRGSRRNDSGVLV